MNLLPSPLRRKSATVSNLEKANAALTAADEALVGHRKRRDDLLLQMADDATVEQAERAVELAERTRRMKGDQARLLEEAQAREEKERARKHRLDLINRNVAALRESDRLAAEFEEALARAVNIADRIVEVRNGVATAWPFDAWMNENCLLVPAGIRRFLAVEFYRLTAHPFDDGLTWPGASCPDVNHIQQPEQIKPFSAAMREGSAVAERAMRGER